jgi:hypothetical protein
MLKKRYRQIGADVDARQHFSAGSAPREIACAHPILFIHSATEGTHFSLNKSHVQTPVKRCNTPGPATSVCNIARSDAPDEETGCKAAARAI